MKDKFKENFAIAIPAAIVTIAILFFSGNASGQVENLSYNALQAIPYFIVLVLALLGLNVLLVLGSGIVLFTIVGFITVKGFSVSLVFSSLGNGTSGMFETIIVAILVSAMGALMKEYGGFDYILYVIKKYFKGKNGGQLGIAVLSSTMDIATANNTVAIVMAAPIAKEISNEYGISPKKTASLMDIFCCIWQGIIPYGAQMLIALGLVAEYKISAFDVIPHIQYVFLLLICALASIFLPDVKSSRKKIKDM
jgi:Na+/H+ antiporter NhaC